MDTLRRILIIDDDPGLRSVLNAALGRDYTVEQACDGRSGIEAAMRWIPDLILLDISMPGMTGYEACMQIKREEKTRHIPVIFLSALSELDDRLAAYEAGCDDFIAKPFDPEELLDKVAIVLRYANDRNQLAEQAQSAFSTAMTAMSTTSEIGVIMNFMRQSFACNNYEQLADMAIESCATLGVSASIQIRTDTATRSRNRSGDSSPMESSVLSTLSECGRIVALGARLAVSYPHITLMILDMPVTDLERMGRLRDDLAWLAEAADSRVTSLEQQLAIQQHGETLARLVERTRAALADIDQRHKNQMASTVQVMHGMVGEMDATLWALGLSEGQEASVSETLRQAIERVHQLFSEGLDIDRHLREITKELAEPVKERAS